MSDLPLRRTLSLIFAPLCLAGAAAFGYLAAGAGGRHGSYGQTAYILLAVLCVVFALLTLTSLVVIGRRARERRAWRRGDAP